MGKIFICYGIPKSASSFTWQLVKRTATIGGLDVATLTVYSKGKPTPEDAIDPVSGKNLALVQEEIADRCAVIKTHGAQTKEAAELVKQGQSKIFVSYRDLRDVALSLIDHGQRSRSRGATDFSQFLEPRDSLVTLTDAVRRMQSWVDTCDPLLISYEDVSFDTENTVKRIAQKLEVQVSVDEVLRFFEHKKDVIIHFNKGVRDRHQTEMDPETSALFLNTFPEYYKRYFPDVRA